MYLYFISNMSNGNLYQMDEDYGQFEDEGYEKDEDGGRGREDYD